MRGVRSKGKEAMSSDAQLLDLISDIVMEEIDAEMEGLCVTLARPMGTYTHDDLISFDWKRVQDHVTTAKAPR